MAPLTLASRYWHAVRDKGLTRLTLERYDRLVRHGLLRRRIYPRLVDLHLASLRLETRRRRARSVPSAEPGVVYVVICVDAEGPTQNGRNRDWPGVEDAVRQVNSARLRRSLTDPAGQPPAIGWYVVDWMVAEHNSRRLTPGCHAIFDRYTPWVRGANSIGLNDSIQWHYHHTFAHRLDGYNRDWSNNPAYEEILCRRILERDYFPSVYRAGHTWEDAECSRWLERFLPFDLSSRGPFKNVHYDWLNAPRSWVLYHPAPNDVQRPGSQRRLMGRCLDVEKPGFELEEVEQAFLDADEGRDSYVAFYFHDSGDMAAHLRRGVSRIRLVAQRYPRVKWLHTDAISMFCNLTGRTPSRRLDGTAKRAGSSVKLLAPHDIFGEPWLAVDVDGQFRRVDMARTANGEWQAPLPTASTWLRAAAAISDRTGRTAVIQIP